jgi:hypothetical protein
MVYLLCGLLYALFLLVVYAMMKAGADADKQEEQLYMKYKEKNNIR